MRVPTVHIGSLEISRLLMGGNPFSGFSHPSRARDAEMLAWYTDERIVATLFEAEELGMKAFLMRADPHTTRVLASYWRQGGTMCWVAQTDSRAETPSEGALYAIEHGAAACYCHGGVADHLIAQAQYAPLYEFQETVRAAGLPCGMAGHLPCDFAWAEGHLDLDFYMVSYYNPTPRDQKPQNDPAAAERYTDEDRDERVSVIATLQRPAIHYKILAAGRTPPEEAFGFAVAHLRPQDATCVGIYTGDNPNMLREDLDMFMRLTGAQS